MSEPFIVQDGVPIPPIERKPRARHQPWKNAVASMQVGQFFFAPERAPRSVSAYAARIAKELNVKLETRRVWAWHDNAAGQWRICRRDAVGAVEGVGVWRTE